MFSNLSCVEFPQSDIDIIGKFYSLNDKILNNETIEFYSDNHYTHTFTLNDKTQISKGKWKLLDSKGTLHLTDWINYSTVGEITSKPSDCMITLVNSQITFSADDYKKNYKKINR